MQIIKCLANNFTIQNFHGLYSEKKNIDAILERNKQDKSKKVCKVMVVGEARTGKTSLVRSLNNQPFDKHQSITNVIEISDFNATSKQSLDNNHDNEVEMKIFDFGGQEIFIFIHPLFQSSQQCFVILVVNQCTQSLERMKQQIEFLQNFHESDILVVSTSFSEQGDEEPWITESDIESLGIDKHRFVAISNKQRKGIEQLVKSMQEMSKLASIGWSLSVRGDCLRQHLTSMQEKHPVICDFKGELARKECDHNHADSFQNDLVILEKSGWVFTFRHGDATNAPLSVIQKNVIVQFLQGLFTIDMHFKKGVLANSLLVNGVISEADFKKYFNKVYQAISGNAADQSKMRESWEIVADLICKFSICHRIGKRQSKGIMPHILFASLLPIFSNNSDQTMWNNLNVKEKAKKGVTRKLIVAGKYGDKRKVMDFIFPRLKIKMWNEVVDVKLCCQDKFVVRGDATPDDFSQEVRNIKNLMIVSRTDNEAISLERIGDCFGRMMQVEEEIERLFVEFRKCFGVILTQNQLKSRNFEVELECSECGMSIPPSSVPQTVDNLEEVCKWMKQAVICKKQDKQHKQFFRNQRHKLEIGRKLKEISEREAVFECCFQQSSEVMVSKYLHCRVIDCSLNADPESISLPHLPHQLKKGLDDFFEEVQKIRESPFTLLLKALEGLKRSVAQLPAFLSILFAELKKLKKAKKSEGEKIFSIEKFNKMKQAIDAETTTWKKMQCVVDMMRTISTLLSKANESKTMKFLQAQEVLFAQAPLHTWDEMYFEDSADPSKAVIVDLMNKFDCPLHFPPFSVQITGFRDTDLARCGEEIKERVILFLQICHGVAELKNAGIVHRDVKLANTVMLARSKWVCISGFGMAIKCSAKNMLLSRDEHKGECGAASIPPELLLSSQSPMDKVDVHSLGLILQELIDSFHFTRKEVKPEVIEFLQELIDSFPITYDFDEMKEGKLEVIEFLQNSRKEWFASTKKG